MPLRQQLKFFVGPEYPAAGYLYNRSVVFNGPRYTVERVAIDDRVPNVISYGWLARPVGFTRKSPVVILLHGSRIHPLEAFDIRYPNEYEDHERYENSAFIRSALDLVEAGYTVLVPWLDDDALSETRPLLPWVSLERAGAGLRVRSKSGGALQFLVNEVVGFADYLQTLPEVDVNRFALIGWHEGAQLAEVVGALDRRFGAVVRLGAPLDRRMLRSTVEGVLDGAAFSHVDCALGDVELAAMVAPRALLYAYSTRDSLISQRLQFRTDSVRARILRLYAGLGSSQRFAVQKDSVWNDRNHGRIREWLDTVLTFEARHVPDSVVAPIFRSITTYQNAWIDSTLRRRESFDASLGTCAPLTPVPNLSSMEAFVASMEVFRSRVARELGLSQPPALGRVTEVKRTLLTRRPGYTVESVQFRSNRSPLLIRGLLAIPDDAVEASYPGMISADGNFGWGRPLDLPEREPAPYLNAYADDLARKGTVVFIPYIPKRFPELAAAELRTRSGNVQTSYSYVLPVMSAAVDFLRTISVVDQARIGIWGISYAGTAALYSAAMDPRISSLVYSNPIESAQQLFRSTDSAVLAAWWPEVCSTIDAVQAYLIAPRAFVRENGIRDVIGHGLTPLESVDRIRQVYESLGIGERFVLVRHDGGHETRASSAKIAAP